jgi:alpha-ketoglutaric semialdehyde dehydrogenase
MITGLNFVAGQWVPAASGATFERHDPADGSVVGTFPASGEADAVAAIEGLAAGWKAWAATSPEKRLEILNKAADIIVARAGSLGEELTREEGKPVGSGKMEWGRAAANLRLYAGEAVRTRGETFPVGDSLVYSAREPLGVITAITPWNFPISIPSRKIGPALATGNAVLFKPSEVSPLTGQRLVEILLEAGVPAGAIALVQGRGVDMADALASHPAVKAVTFTGSYATGCAIHAKAGPGRRLQLEMGGKNPAIVLADADPAKAAKIIAQGAFNLTGQACTATSRAIIVGDAYDDIVARVKAIAEGFVLGAGMDAATTMAPIASKAQYDHIRRMIQVGLDEGLELITGGGDLPERSEAEGGFFVKPTIFGNVPRTSRLAMEEIFGPVLAFHRAESYEDAITCANQVEYGLAASIVTNDLARVMDFASDIEAGIIKVNSATGGVAGSAPFGGIKHSSNQTYKEQAGHGVMDFYTLTKTVYLAG